MRHTQATVKKKGKDLFHPARKVRGDRLLHLHIRIPSLGLFLRSWPPLCVLLLTNLPLLRNPHFFHAVLDSNARRIRIQWPSPFKQCDLFHLSIILTFLTSPWSLQTLNYSVRCFFYVFLTDIVSKPYTCSFYRGCQDRTEATFATATTWLGAAKLRSTSNLSNGETGAAKGVATLPAP